MAKERTITRTITATHYNVFGVNTETGETNIYTYVLTGKISSEKALKTLKKSHETETLKLVYIESTSTDTALYEMSEADFIAHATKVEK